MATPIYYPPLVNNLQKEINADYTAGASTVTLNNTTNIQNKPGVCVVSRVNSAGTRQVVSKWTYLKFTGTSGNTLTGVTAISGDQDHAIGEVVEFVPDVTWSEQVAGGFATLLDSTDVSKVNTTNVITPDGTQELTNKTITSPTITTPSISSPTITGTPVLNADSAVPFYNDSMARQAIMNGNFDVWQRGTTGTPADTATIYTADRWSDVTGKDGGTLPTLSRTRELLTSGDLPNSFYCSRLTSNGTGTSLGVSSYHRYQQKIEHGTRLLCGLNKKVTVSFWARSSIANKRLGITLFQSYGTGGSPSAVEKILSTPITLTSTLTKYTVTFTTNTLVGKTFGTANDDYLSVIFYDQWGTTVGNADVQASITAETYGNGTLDIAQVQLCAGEVALPFQPKSFEEELRACRRYCYGITTVATTENIAYGFNSSTTSANFGIPLQPQMRIAPTLPASVAVDSWQVTEGGAGIDTTNLVLSSVSGKDNAILVATVSSGLTANRPSRLQSNGTGGRVLILDAEL